MDLMVYDDVDGDDDDDIHVDADEFISLGDYNRTHPWLVGLFVFDRTPE